MTKDKKQRKSHHGAVGLKEPLYHWIRRFHRFMHSCALCSRLSSVFCFPVVSGVKGFCCSGDDDLSTSEIREGRWLGRRPRRKELVGRRLACHGLGMWVVGGLLCKLEVRHFLVLHRSRTKRSTEVMLLFLAIHSAADRVKSGVQ